MPRDTDQEFEGLINASSVHSLPGLPLKPGRKLCNSLDQSAQLHCVCFDMHAPKVLLFMSKLSFTDYLHCSVFLYLLSPLLIVSICNVPMLTATVYHFFGLINIEYHC